MARKRTDRGNLEGQIHVDLQPEELLQLKNICIIRMESNLEGFCRKLILEGLKREATDILSSVALSYRLEQAKVPLGDQETDPSTSRKARDACGPVCNPLEITLDEFIEEKLSSSSKTAPTQAAFRLKRNPKLPYQGEPFPDELDPPDLDKKGLRGGEADEESLKKEQGTERANMQSELAALHADDPRALAASKILAHHQYGNAKGHEVDQYAIGLRETSITNTERLKGEEDEI